MNTFEEIRTQSLKILEQEGVPENKNLPILDSLQLRSKEDIAARLVIQYALAGLADEVSPEFIKDWLEENNLFNQLDDYERHFLDAKSLNEEQINELSWKQESLWTLCWVGKLVDELGFPAGECDLSSVFPRIPPDVDCQEFISNFLVREEWEILQAVDLYYCLHSSYRHPELWVEKNFPGSLKVEVLLERRLALEWVVDPNTAWHDISLDT